MDTPEVFDVCQIDGDKYIIAAGFGSQKVVKGELIHLDPPNFACYKAKLMLDALKKKIPANKYNLFIGDPTTKHFRYKIAKTQGYKANRDPTKRPIHEQVIRDYLINAQGAISVSGIEVDDMVVMEQVKATKSGLLSIIVSNDKDVNQGLGWHHDPDFGTKRKINEVWCTLKAYMKTDTYYLTDPGFLSLRTNGKKKKLVGGAQLWFCAQLLMGDKTDNIPGLPANSRGTYGDVKAYNALKNCKTYEEGIKTVWKLYKEKLKDKLTLVEIKERFLEVSQLLWIKRDLNEKIFPKEWL